MMTLPKDETPVARTEPGADAFARDRLPRRRSAVGFVLVSVIGLLMAAILTLFYALKVQDASREQRVVANTLWFATQLNREVMRLQQAVADAMLAPADGLDDAIDQVRLRGDIVGSRVQKFSDGTLDARYGEHAVLLRSRQTLIGGAGAIAALLNGLDQIAGRPAALARLRTEAKALADLTNSLVIDIYQADAEERAGERQKAYLTARLLLVLVAGLTLAMFALLVQQLRQARASAATQLRMESVERDNRAKSLELERRDEQATMLMREAAVAETVSRFNSAMNASVKRLAVMIEDIAWQCEEMNGAAVAVRDGSERAADSSSRAATHVEDVARTAGQLSLSARDVSRKTAESLDAAGDVRSHALASGGAIRELTAAAAQIDSVTKLIASIASRTNLLALNATIEAARAGDAGRGFAVVAAEVKSLAQQTARAVSDIDGQIQAIQTASELCVRTLDEIGRRVGALDTIGDQITTIVDDQTRSVERVAGMIGNASSDTRDASSTARLAREAADRANAAAATMLRLTADVNAEARRIRGEIEAFAFPLEPGVPDPAQRMG